MSISTLAIHRPVATALLTLGLAIAGIFAFQLLSVAPLPQVDFPTLIVQANLPGASPETMAASVATPLERSLGRIAGINEMTSVSSQGQTRVVLQFDLDRDSDGAARDVQAAINAARNLLPTGMPSNPTWRKFNPADSPILMLALTSDTDKQGRMYDIAATVIAQKLSQLEGVGQVNINGSSLPAVRVDVNPTALFHYGLALEDIRKSVQAANVNAPKGALEHGDRHWQIDANDEARTAADYRPLIVSYKNGAAVRLSDVATVEDSVQDLRNAGSVSGRPAVLLVVFRQPGANLIETVDRIKATLPQLRASVPPTMALDIVLDRTPTIRGSLHEVERALMISVALVILVVFLFLRNGRATIIPSVAVPLSLCGTFVVMYAFGFTLDNFSLMALTIATGFVVDDAIVVLENVSRHIENGMKPFAAAVRGAREVSFTVVSMSLSLIAVFIPLLLMGGLVGRLFREFAMTLSAAILVSLVISLTTTPMLCARWLKRENQQKHGRLYHLNEKAFNALLRRYDHSLQWALRHQRLMLLSLVATVALNVWLFAIVPKGFFPEQDTGRLIGFIQADQSISFTAMRAKLKDFIDKILADKAVESAVEYTGGFGAQANTSSMYIVLKPLDQRRESAGAVVNRLREKLGHEPGASLYLQPMQDFRVGGRRSASTYQYTLQGSDLAELRAWIPRIEKAMTALPELRDINSDEQDGGLQNSLVIDRDAASRMGVSMQQITAALGNAFSQRQVSVIYNALNQYYVVLGVAPQFQQNPEALRDIYLIGSGGARVPLSTLTHLELTNTPLAVNHQGQFAAATISFNLAPNVSLSAATEAIDRSLLKLGVPTSIRGGFQGSAQVFQSSLSSQPWLILAALVTVYIVLGILYESYVHPLTILSTLPSAGVGAILALLICRSELDLIALIGILLLIGIVKKNAIMMIDFALVAEREHNLDPREAIYQACMMRFRPILMTTLAAMLGALPLAIGFGEGSELRRPLGISIVGGLIVSQALTLYTTPVVYLYLDRFRLKCLRAWRRIFPLPVPSN